MELEIQKGWKLNENVTFCYREISFLSLDSIFPSFIFFYVIICFFFDEKWKLMTMLNWVDNRDKKRRIIDPLKLRFIEVDVGGFETK